MFTAVMVLGGLTLLLTWLLAWADKRLRVAEDPRIDAVEAMLPHANCGACGFPGCRAFAQALLRGDAVPAQCSVSVAAAQARVAAFLGVAVGTAEKRVARLACAGGDNVARKRADYQGPSSCRAAALVGGGGKACAWGCLGLGDCARVCQFGAIVMNAHGLPVVDEVRCTACGDCVRVCPKELFSIHPAEHRLWVACKNELAGDEIVADCAVACTACGRCAMDGPGLITMHNHLPVIDYSGDHQTREPTQRCPTGAIVWIEASGAVLKGRASAPVLRERALR